MHREIVKMDIKTYNYLPEEARYIREDVFIKEQGFVDEFDDIDAEAVHLVLFEKGKAVATCRYFYSQEHSCYAIGRIAVQKEFRGKCLGAEILSTAEQMIKREFRADGKITVGLSAQLQAEPFYQKQGYKRTGEEYLEETCPHVWMQKKI